MESLDDIAVLVFISCVTSILVSIMGAPICDPTYSTGEVSLSPHPPLYLLLLVFLSLAILTGVQ